MVSHCHAFLNSATSFHVLFLGFSQQVREVWPLFLASLIPSLYIDHARMMISIETPGNTCIKYWGSPGTCCAFIRLNQNQSWNPFQKWGWTLKMNQRRSHWTRPYYHCTLFFKKREDWSSLSDRNRFCTSIVQTNREKLQFKNRLAKICCNPSDLLTRCEHIIGRNVGPSS